MNAMCMERSARLQNRVVHSTACTGYRTCAYCCILSADASCSVTCHRCSVMVRSKNSKVCSADGYQTGPCRGLSNI